MPVSCELQKVKIKARNSFQYGIEVDGKQLRTTKVTIHPFDASSSNMAVVTIELVAEIDVEIDNCKVVTEIQET